MNIKDYYNTNQYETDLNKGWHSLVKLLCKTIIQLDDTVEVIQVKQKFGYLRFYINPTKNTQIIELIRVFENHSGSICEECGSYRRVRLSKGLYIQALCYKCRKRLL